MGGNQSRDGSIDSDQNLEEVVEAGRDCCIYRVPFFLSRRNEEIYAPRVVSIGPLHHGDANLMGMEKQKQRLLSSFEGRVGGHVLEEFQTFLRDQEQLIRNYYSVTRLPNRKFFSVILLDSVFIVELLMRFSGGPDEFLLNNVQLRSKIFSDLTLIENQIPFFVLEWLHSTAFPMSQGHMPFFLICTDYFARDILGSVPQYQIREQIRHFTDLMRHLHTPVERAIEQATEQATVPQLGVRQVFDIPTATKLYASGLEFRAVDGPWTTITLGKSESGTWLPWLEATELRIPTIGISPDTEYHLKNMMAFELFYYPTDTKLCHYAQLMDCLIDTTEDVDLLVEKEIIINSLGDSESVVKMFNGICKDILLTRSPYTETIMQMKAHYRQPWNRWKATLKRTYFSDIWTGTATFAAVFLLILTIVQAVCSILQVK